MKHLILLQGDGISKPVMPHRIIFPKSTSLLLDLVDPPTFLVLKESRYLSQVETTWSPGVPSLLPIPGSLGSIGVIDWTGIRIRSKGLTANALIPFMQRV